MKPCAFCGVNATHTMAGTHPRNHRCPHGAFCRPQDLREGLGLQLPFRGGGGQQFGCAWCLARNMVDANLQREGYPNPRTWRRVVFGV